ncbi:hypothetical protein [Candidatus Endomicrobiellum devescovinae]|uniref:hypothetical protein n=1 Tax=Candidatus Endomicrobiellum devescovinae TaxID=3242322 RepID=UPI0028305BF0|nr:hypothetical protein [Endomicrobium sp.]
MKKMILLLLLSCFCFAGCISTYKYTSKLFPPRDENEIEVYSITLPARPYIEIAEIVGSSKDVLKLKREAFKLGADAIIIVGSEGTKTSVGVCSSSFLTKVTKAGGRKAIAIKYTNQEE